MEAKQNTMLGVIAKVWVTLCLGYITVFAAQLPPEMLVDKYLLQAKMLSEEKKHEGALEAMDRIVVLQKTHDLTLPGDFPFHYAQTALAAGAVQAAIDSANRLSVGDRQGGQVLSAGPGAAGEGRAEAPGACCRPGWFHAGEAGSRTTTPGSAAGLDADTKDNCGATDGGLQEMEHEKVLSESNG